MIKKGRCGLSSLSLSVPGLTGLAGCPRSPASGRLERRATATPPCKPTLSTVHPTPRLVTMGLEDDLLRDLEGDEDGGEDYEETVDAGSPSGEGPEDRLSTQTSMPKKRKGQHNGEGGGSDDGGDGEDDQGDDDGDEEMEYRVKEEEVEMLIPEGGVRPAEELQADDVAQMELKNVKDVASVAKLSGSKAFKEVLQVSAFILMRKVTHTHV